MNLLPALDLRGGKCVRLLQGNDEAVTVYGEDPMAVAEMWAHQGAHWLHIVNLDGAFGRASENLSIVERIASGVGVNVEFGGGLRNEADVDRVLAMGIRKVVLGTLAFKNRPALRRILLHHGSDRVIVAIDARDGIVATEGWTTSAGIPVLDAANEMEKEGVKEVLFTDVGRDGMLVGPDSTRVKELLEQTGLNVIASGGGLFTFRSRSSQGSEK
ncbi:MAG: 1-(5-phosphoribosyl)-5-[(5-phosphoribosylamino)methylideneamino] imidazole-4-carboxamide isomerase [Bacteroidota bacterium]